LTAPIRSMPEYELYRVVMDYEALQDAFADRIEDLNTPLTEIDEAGGLTRGNMQRLLSSTNPDDWRPQGVRKQSRSFGWETLAKALEGTGMALVLVVDDARFAPIKERLATRKRVRKPSIAGSVKPTWLFTKKKAREMGKKRFAGMTELQRKRLARKAGKASGRARRRKARASGALLASTAPASSPNGQSPPNA
jgi:hypothetical protein